jgi:hypothetical protein
MSSGFSGGFDLQLDFLGELVILLPQIYSLIALPRIAD